MTNRNDTLRGFIETELIKRSMSAREFAKFVGVSSSTISRAMAFDNKTEPSLSFLNKLASATSTDICTLVYLVYPDSRPTRSAEMQRLADDIGKLPPDMQQLVDSLIVGMVVKQSNDNANKS